MKKVKFLGIALALSANVFSQNINDQVEVLRDMAATERRALVADNLMLTEEESKIFWPMYDEFRNEAKKVGTRRIELIQEFANNYESMSNEKSVEIMNEYLSIESSYTKLKSTYKDKMIKSLNGKLVFRYFQIENKIDAVIAFGLASEIPLVMKQ